MSADDEPYAFATSLAASSTDLQGADDILPYHISPSLGLNPSGYLSEVLSYGSTPNSPISEDCSAKLDLGISFDCTPSTEYSLFEANSYIHAPQFGVLSGDASHNTYDRNSATTSSDSSGMPTPYTTTCSIPAFALAEGPDVDSEVRSINNFSTDNQRWHATQSRSRAADGSFLYGVLTTKIFCRPSCASRRPSRRHVRFFVFPGAIEAAEQANFRPCKRCIPEIYGVKTSGALKICQVLRTIIAGAFDVPEAWSKPTMKLESLAKLAGLSTFHFHRVFKATTQVAPGDFINSCRALALQDTLRSASDPESGLLTDASTSVKTSSYWSPRMARKALGGISPTDFASGAPSRLIQYCRATTPCGLLNAVFSADKHFAHPKLHTVFFAQGDGEQECQHFPTAQLSHHYEARLQECVNQLEQNGRDRDTELTADVLPALWRVRVWLRFLRD